MLANQVRKVYTYLHKQVNGQYRSWSPEDTHKGIHIPSAPSDDNSGKDDPPS